MNAIEMNGICKRYGDFSIEDVSLTLPQGCVLGLVGENGAGKSTLIRMLMGACRPDSGQVHVLGIPAGRSRPSPPSSRRSVWCSTRHACRMS